MAMVYSWKSHFPSRGVDVNEVRRVIDRIRERNGTVAPEALVDEGRPRRSPIHDLFNWDDRSAAEAYRTEQARGIIRAIEVREENADDPEPVRAYVCVERENQDQTVDMVYVPLHRALADQNDGQLVLDRVAAELESFQRKWEKYSQLRPIMLRIRNIVQHLRNANLPV